MRIMEYRCPVDDVVFKTQNIDRAPTLEGHPECPGPECRLNFKGYSGAANVDPVVPVVSGESKRAADIAGAGVSVLEKPTAGQGW